MSDSVECIQDSGVCPLGECHSSYSCWDSFSAKPEREVASCMRKYLLQIASLSYSSAAINVKRRANFSCMDVKEMVSLACSHKCGRASRHAQCEPIASADYQSDHEAVAILSHHPSTQETTVARVHTWPATFH